jgi:hypothetical protein
MSEQDQEQLEATTPDDTQEIEINLDDTETVEATSKTYTDKEFKQVLARAKKAEEENKTLKSKPTEATQALSVEDVEAKILQSKGIDSELLAEMKVVAKIRGKSILEVENDPIVVAMKEEKERKAKEEKSRLGSPRGSGSVKPKKDFNSPGLSEEEHREMVRNSLR